jgi:hypothetical protein
VELSNLKPGETARINGPDVVLHPFGWIEFNVTPPNTRITYRLANTPGAEVTAKNGETVRVKAGRYAITSSADTYNSQTDFVDVEAGKGKQHTQRLQLIANSVPPAPTVVLDPASSQLPYRLFRPLLPGTYAFKLRLRGRFGRQAKWVVNYVDNSNYIEYEIDNRNLKYTTRQNGKEQSQSVQHGINPSAPDVYDLTMVVSDNEIQISSAGRRIQIPTPPGSGSLLTGRIGFHRDEILESYQVTPAAAK